MKIYSGQSLIVSYVGISSFLGSSGRIGDDDSVEYLMDTFTPGSYTLALPTAYFGQGGKLDLDSATLTITQDGPAVPPIAPLAPPPVVTASVAVTPEPSTFALLGTGLLGIAGAVRRR